MSITENATRAQTEGPIPFVSIGTAKLPLKVVLEQRNHNDLSLLFAEYPALVTDLRELLIAKARRAEEVNRIAREVKKQILQLEANAEIILYGSQARNESHDESDWDLLILTEDKVDPSRENDFRHSLFELGLEADQVFSVFLYAKEDWLVEGRDSDFIANVRKEGIRI